MFGEYASDSVVAGESAEWLVLCRLYIESPAPLGGGIDGGDRGASALTDVNPALLYVKLSRVGAGDGNSKCV